jgi:hypothetical protein
MEKLTIKHHRAFSASTSSELGQVDGSSVIGGPNRAGVLEKGLVRDS